jgi:predicted Zn-dependent protease
VQQYVALVAAKPDYGAAREALAKLYLRLRQAQSAVEQLDAALGRSGDVPELLELRADARAQAGEPAAAKADYSKALALAVDRKDKARISGKLKIAIAPSASRTP